MVNLMDKIIDWNLDRLPKEPITQMQYMYYLQTIILCTLIGFTLNNVWLIFAKGSLTYLFGAILTGVFAMMSLFSYKQTRTAYLSLKNSKDMMNKAVDKVADEITPEMIENLRKSANNHGKSTNSNTEYTGERSSSGTPATYLG